MADFALLLIGFIFAGWALICFDPKTRFPDEGEPDFDWVHKALWKAKWEAESQQMGIKIEEFEDGNGH